MNPRCPAIIACAAALTLVALTRWQQGRQGQLATDGYTLGYAEGYLDGVAERRPVHTVHN